MVGSFRCTKLARPSLSAVSALYCSSATSFGAGTARMKLTFTPGSGHLQQQLHLDCHEQPHQGLGLVLGTSSMAWPSTLSKPARSLRHFVKRVADDEVGLGAADLTDQLKVIDQNVAGLPRQDIAPATRYELDRMKPLLRSAWPKVDSRPA